jgi:hypothetical protein
MLMLSVSLPYIKILALVIIRAKSIASNYLKYDEESKGFFSSDIISAVLCYSRAVEWLCCGRI